jgi:hypothetical protein
MKCPTCGESIKKGQAVCSFCGALASPETPQPTLRQSGMQPPALPRASSPPAPPQPAAFEEIRPATMEEIGEDQQPWPEVGFPSDLPVPESRPAAPASSPMGAGRRTPPAWTRLIAPLFYVLVFLALQFWMRDTQREDAGRPPVLQTAGTCEQVVNGQPTRPKSVFSKREDRQVVFFSTWRGSPAEHQYAVRWRSPDGATINASPAPTVTSASGREFTVEAKLPIEPSRATGLWRAEVLQDSKTMATSSFELAD